MLFLADLVSWHELANWRRSIPKAEASSVSFSPRELGNWQRACLPGCNPSSQTQRISPPGGRAAAQRDGDGGGQAEGRPADSWDLKLELFFQVSLSEIQIWRVISDVSGVRQGLNNCQDYFSVVMVVMTKFIFVVPKTAILLMWLLYESNRSSRCTAAENETGFMRDSIVSTNLGLVSSSCASHTAGK